MNKSSKVFLSILVALFTTLLVIVCDINVDVEPNIEIDKIFLIGDQCLETFNIKSVGGPCDRTIAIPPMCQFELRPHCIFRFYDDGEPCFTLQGDDCISLLY